MPDSTTFHVPIFILLSFVASGLTQRQCFWPDNSLAVNYLPCQDQPNTSCCFAGEACLDSGLCYGALGLVYRGACTGSDYAGSACPQQCVGILNNTWANLYPCTEGTGAPGPVSFWCGHGNICQDNNNGGGIFYDGLVPSNVATVVRNGSAPPSTSSNISPSTATALTTSSNISPSTATASTTSSPSLSAAQNSTKLSQAAQVGLGVGIGIGLPIMVLLSVLLWRTRRGTSADVQAKGPAVQERHQSRMLKELHGQQVALEMGGDTTHVAELPSH